MSPYDLNFRHLLAVSAIAATGGVSRAAEAAHMSQPAITQALGKLETVLGHRLFDRRPDGMTPTPAGAALVDRVNRAADELREAFGMMRPELSRRPQLAEAMLRKTSFTHLKAVIAAVGSGNFVLAARASGASSPAIHRAVRDFERLCGVSLFVRRGRTVTPTRQARHFTAAARRGVAEIEAGLTDLSALGGESRGRIAIGAMPLARAELAPRAVASFHRSHSLATVAIADGPYAELYARLIAGDLDLLIGALREPHPSPEVVQKALYEDRLVVVARAGHPLVRGQVQLTDLERYPWIMAPPGTPMRAVWEAIFEDAGRPPPAVSVECSSVLAIHGLLIEGDWLTLLSPEQVNREVASGRLVVLEAPLPGRARPIGVTFRANWRPSALQADFLRCLEIEAALRPPVN